MPPFEVVVLDPYHEDATALLHSNPEFSVTLPADPQFSSWRAEADAVMIRSETRLLGKDL